MIKTTNGQICTLNSPKQPKNKVPLNLLKNSSWLLKLKSTTKNASVLFSKISKLLRSLKGAKLRFGNAATVVTLLLVQKHQKFAQSALTLNPTSKFDLKIINFKNPQPFDLGIFAYSLTKIALFCQNESKSSRRNLSNEQLRTKRFGIPYQVLFLVQFSILLLIHQTCWVFLALTTMRFTLYLLW